MTQQPVTLDTNDKIAFALHKMNVGGYRHLPILFEGKLAGVISIRDILRYLTERIAVGPTGAVIRRRMSLGVGRPLGRRGIVPMACSCGYGDRHHVAETRQLKEWKTSCSPALPSMRRRRIRSRCSRRCISRGSWASGPPSCRRRPSGGSRPSSIA